MSSIPITLTMQGIPPREERFCIKCAHLLGNRSYKENWQNWKCAKTQTVTGTNLVTGETMYAAAFCENVREGVNFCGLEGKWYEEYITPQLLEVPEVDKPRKGRLTATDLDNL